MRQVLSRRAAAVRLFVAVACVAIGVSVYASRAGSAPLVDVQLGGADQPWPRTDRVAVEQALRWDLVLIAATGSLCSS
jgi:hypothetical protein